MSNSFTNQTIAQIELFTKNDEYEKQVYVLPKHLDEKVARLHLDALGAKLTELTPEQAAYIGVPRRGPVQAGPLPLLGRCSAVAGRALAGIRSARPAPHRKDPIVSLFARLGRHARANAVAYPGALHLASAAPAPTRRTRSAAPT